MATPFPAVRATLLMLAISASSAQAAQTLIFCSEGSPEGFDAARYTAGTTFDAAAETIYNRLVEFERGGTRVIPGHPGTGRDLDHQRRWADLHLQPAQRREIPQDRLLHADPRFQRR